MINIEQTSLYNEVLAVRGDGAKPVFFYWTVEIHTPTNNYTTQNSPIKVLEVDIVRDYQKNISDEMTVKVLIPMGLWAKQLYPNRASLEISLYKNPLLETAGGEDYNSNTQAQRYMASPVLEGLPILQGKDIDTIGEDTLNLRDILQVTFQVISKTVDKLRMVTIGGIYRNTNVENVIKGILSVESNKVNVDTGSTIEGVDMVPATNATVRDHVVLPHGLKLVDMPIYIQDRCGGVYSAGINAYVQDRMWYVYPLYDNTRLQQSPANVTIVKIPETLSKGSERTYRQTGSSVLILATSNSNFGDDAGTNFLTHGNGVRFADADKYMGNLMQSSNNKTVALRGQTLNELVSVDQADRNNVHVSDRKINANPYREYSKLAMINGSRYTFIWDNSDPALLTPGMMIKILYLSNDNVEEENGVLLYSHPVIQIQGKNIQSTRHTCTTACVVFVSKNNAEN